MRWIGVDLHKHYAHVVELVGEEVYSSRIAIPDDLGAFCDRLGQGDHVILEASTNSFRFAEIVGERAGRVVVCDAAHTRGVVGKAAMNDQNSATALARLLQTDFVRPVWTPPAEIRALRCQVDHYRDLDKTRTQTINRIRSLFQQEMSDYQPGPTISGKSHSGMVEQFTDQPRYRLYLCSLLRQLNVFNSELAQIEFSFSSWCRQSNEANLLLTIPGISTVVATVLMAHIGSIDRFPAAERLCSYAGLVPRVYQSGKVKRSGRITRSGPGIMRWALNIAILNQRTYATNVMTFKQKLAERRPKMVAKVAACRKLLAVIWSMLKHGRPFRDEDTELTARKKHSLGRCPEPSPEAFEVPLIRNPRPSNRGLAKRRKPQCVDTTDSESPASS